MPAHADEGRRKRNGVDVLRAEDGAAVRPDLVGRGELTDKESATRRFGGVAEIGLAVVHREDGRVHRRLLGLETGLEGVAAEGVAAAFQHEEAVRDDGVGHLPVEREAVLAAAGVDAPASVGALVEFGAADELRDLAAEAAGDHLLAFLVEEGDGALCAADAHGVLVRDKAVVELSRGVVGHEGILLRA